MHAHRLREPLERLTRVRREAEGVARRAPDGVGDQRRRGFGNADETRCKIDGFAVVVAEESDHPAVGKAHADGMDGSVDQLEGDPTRRRGVLDDEHGLVANELYDAAARRTIRAIVATEAARTTSVEPTTSAKPTVRCRVTAVRSSSVDHS